MELMQNLAKVVSWDYYQRTENEVREHNLKAESNEFREETNGAGWIYNHIWSVMVLLGFSIIIWKLY